MPPSTKWGYIALLMSVSPSAGIPNLVQMITGHRIELGSPNWRRHSSRYVDDPYRFSYQSISGQGHRVTLNLTFGRPNLVQMITWHRIELGPPNLAQTFVLGCNWTLSIFRSMFVRSSVSRDDSVSQETWQARQRHFGCTRKPIERLRRRFCVTRNVADRSRSGRPRVTTEHCRWSLHRLAAPT